MAISPLKIPDRFFGENLPIAPDLNEVVDKVDELVAAVNAGLATSNAIVGGDKFVQYRLSQLFGVPPEAMTLDRLDPATILPGVEATVINSSDSPMSSEEASKSYVATLVPDGTTAGAFQVPAYTGATDQVWVVWQEVVSADSFTPLLASELNPGKGAYAGLALRPLLIALVNGIGTATTVTTQPPTTVETKPPTNGVVDDTGDSFSGIVNPLYPALGDYELYYPGSGGNVPATAGHADLQGNRIVVRDLAGNIPPESIGIRVAANGSRPASAWLTNKTAFTITTVGTPTTTALAVSFTIASTTIAPGQSISFSAAARGGTAPYEHLVEAKNIDTATVTQLGSAGTAGYAGVWQAVPAGIYDLTDTVTDADGGVKVSIARRLTVSSTTTPGGGSIIVGPTQGSDSIQVISTTGS
jgi:hypothetical protein